MSDEAHFHVSRDMNKQTYSYWKFKNNINSWASNSSSEGHLFVLLCGHFEFWELFSFERKDDEVVPIHSRLLQCSDWWFTCTTINGQHNQYLVPAGWSSFTCGKNSYESYANFFQDGLSPAFGDLPCLAHSSELSVLDLFLWGYLRNGVWDSAPYHIWPKEIHSWRTCIMSWQISSNI
jgi:hypothetical protein